MSNSKSSAGDTSLNDLGINFVSAVCKELEKCNSRISELEKFMALSNKQQRERYELHSEHLRKQMHEPTHHANFKIESAQVVDSQLTVEEKHVPTLPVEHKSIKVDNNTLPLVLMSPNVSNFNKHVGTIVSAPTPTNEAGWRTTRTGSSRRKLELDANDSFLDTPQENILAKLSARKEDHGVLPTTKCNIASNGDSHAAKRSQLPEHSKVPLVKSNLPVRKKRDREELKGIECHQCKQFYDAIAAKDVEGVQGVLPCYHVNEVSRHRFKYLPPSTPEGFWNIGFDDSEQLKYLF
ncbi:unnamed protein product [Calypogeia fissa]